MLVCAALSAGRVARTRGLLNLVVARWLADDRAAAPAIREWRSGRPLRALLQGVIITEAGPAVGTLLAAVASSLGLIIVGRFIQGAAGGIFPLAFGIVRDEFPREKVAGSIGLLSAILGVGGGAGIVLSGVIIQHLSYHWLFWIPLVAIVLAAVATWRYIPESPVRVPGRINWLAATLMTLGISAVLLAISETTTWGWGSARTLGLILVGVAFSVSWIAVEVRSREPLIDMTMMRVRGVWTTNTVAFLLGAGMYSSFIVFPQFAQLPRSTGFGFGASVVVSGLYLVPSAIGMTILGVYAGRISARFGSRAALLAGTAFTTASFALLVVAHGHPYDLLIARRRPRWTAVGDVHRRSHSPRPAHGDRLHRHFRDGHGLSGDQPRCRGARPQGTGAGRHRSWHPRGWRSLGRRRRRAGLVRAGASCAVEGVTPRLPHPRRASPTRHGSPDAGAEPRCPES